jgi:hypothetical protein
MNSTAASRDFVSATPFEAMIFVLVPFDEVVAILLLPCRIEFRDQVFGFVHIDHSILVP